MDAANIINRDQQSRRAFLRQSAAAAAAFAVPTIIPSSARGADGQTAPSNRITVGFIGTGDHGTGWNLPPFLNHKDARVVAVCDVDNSHMERAKGMVNRHYKNEDCFATRDFREVLARKDIDFLGDIALGLPTIRTQAAEYGHTFEEELHYCLCHGILHLMGYEDKNRTAFKKMHRKQDQILTRVKKKSA